MASPLSLVSAFACLDTMGDYGRGAPGRSSRVTIKKEEGTNNAIETSPTWTHGGRPDVAPGRRAGRRLTRLGSCDGSQRGASPRRVSLHQPLPADGLECAALRRAQPGAHHPAQRLPATALGHARRQHRAADPEAAPGQLLPGSARAARARRARPPRGGPTGVRGRRLHEAGRRPRALAGLRGHLQEPGVTHLRRARLGTLL